MFFCVVDGMVQYVRKNMPLISKELISVDDVEAFIERHKYSVIGCILIPVYRIMLYICKCIYLL